MTVDQWRKNNKRSLDNELIVTNHTSNIQGYVIS